MMHDQPWNLADGKPLVTTASFVFATEEMAPGPLLKEWLGKIPKDDATLALRSNATNINSLFLLSNMTEDFLFLFKRR